MPSPNLIYINGIAFSVELRRISSHELYIPISFLTENINNLNIEYDEKGNTITVSRAFNEEEVMSEEDFVYYELETKNVKQNTIQNLIEDEYFTEEDEASQYGYYYG